MCLNQQDSEYASGPKYAKNLNMAKFWIRQGSPYASVTQRSEYAICYDKVFNIFWILNMPGFWKWQGSEYARVTQGSKYATIWLNMSQFTITVMGLNMHHTIYSVRPFCKLIGTCWEIDVFRTPSNI